MPGMHGTVAAVAAFQLQRSHHRPGARFDDRVTGKLDSFAPHAKVIHADIDPAEMGRIATPTSRSSAISNLHPRPHRGVPPDARGENRIGNEGINDPDLADWWSYLNGIQETFPLGWSAPQDGSLSPEYVIEQLGRIAGPDAIYVAGVGQHQMWAAQFIKYEKPRTC